jgi:hypothetical protein
MARMAATASRGFSLEKKGTIILRSSRCVNNARVATASVD